MTQFTRTEALRMMTLNEFRHFENNDWYGFSGCNAKSPLIVYTPSEVLILDEDYDGNPVLSISGNTDETVDEPSQCFGLGTVFLEGRRAFSSRKFLTPESAALELSLQTEDERLELTAGWVIEKSCPSLV